MDSISYDISEFTSMLGKIGSAVLVIVANFFISIIEKYAEISIISILNTIPILNLTIPSSQNSLIFQSLFTNTITTAYLTISVFFTLFNVVGSVLFYQKLLDRLYYEDFDGLLSMLEGEKDVNKELLIMLMIIVLLIENLIILL